MKSETAREIIQRLLHSAEATMEWCDFEKLAYAKETHMIELKAPEVVSANTKKRTCEHCKSELEPTGTKQILESVCAFANTEGGVILIGGTEHDDCPDLSKGLESAMYGKKTTIRDWLNNVICGGVGPPISNYRIQSVQHENKHYFAVVIGKSEDMPHATGGVFYRRAELCNQPIRDPLTIRDMFHRAKQAVVHTEWKVWQKTNNVQYGELLLHNAGHVVAEAVFVICTIVIDSGGEVAPSSERGEWTRRPNQQTIWDATIQVDYLYPAIVRSCLHVGLIGEPKGQISWRVAAKNLLTQNWNTPLPWPTTTTV